MSNNTPIAFPAKPRPLTRIKRPTHIQRKVVLTRVSTGVIVTAAVAKSWHFVCPADAARFAEGLRP